MRLTKRRAAGAAGALLLVVATCYLPLDLKHEGGGWYTHYSSAASVDSRGRTNLYRKGFAGASMRVDDNVYVSGFYPPDCIIYEPHRHAGIVYAGCGLRAPVPVAWYPFYTLDDRYAVTPAGLARTDSVRVVERVAVATVARVSIDDIRRAARSQPPLFPGWSFIATRRVAIAPTIRDEPVDVNARTSNGMTPLIEAARRRQPDVVEALLKAGADPCLRDEQKRSVADHARNSQPALLELVTAAFARCDLTVRTP